MTDTEERCKHWLVKAHCTYCTPPDRSQVGHLDSSHRRRGRRGQGRRFQKADLSGMWSKVGFLAVRASVWIDTRDEEMVAECRSEYLNVTGEEADHIRISTGKWGHSVAFDFHATDSELLLAGIAIDQIAPSTRDVSSRVLSNAALGWALFDLGFRVGGHQDIGRIRENVPEHGREAFDKGVAIGEK